MWFDVAASLIMRGRIEVKPREAWQGDIELTVGGQIAEVKIAARKRRETRAKRKSFT